MHYTTATTILASYSCISPWPVGLLLQLVTCTGIDLQLYSDSSLSCSHFWAGYYLARVVGELQLCMSGTKYTLCKACMEV